MTWCNFATLIYVFCKHATCYKFSGYWNEEHLFWNGGYFTFSSKERELKWSKVLSFCKLKNFITDFGVFQEIEEVEGL